MAAQSKTSPLSNTPIILLININKKLPRHAPGSHYLLPSIATILAPAPSICQGEQEKIPEEAIFA